jgi:hypothetical protein
MAGDLVRTQIQDGVAGLTRDLARGQSAANSPDWPMNRTAISILLAEVLAVSVVACSERERDQVVHVAPDDPEMAIGLKFLRATSRPGSTCETGRWWATIP